MRTKGQQNIGFDTIINQCKGTLVKLCQFYTRGNPDDFPDLFQDILIALWEQWPTFQGKSSVNTWVYSIARNTAVNHLRHRKKRIQFLTLDQDLYHEIADDNNDLYQLLYELIERLDNDTDREILYLHLEKKTSGEIATLTGISESAIRQRIHRTIEQLKKLNQQEK